MHPDERENSERSADQSEKDDREDEEEGGPIPNPTPETIREDPKVK